MTWPPPPPPRHGVPGPPDRPPVSRIPLILCAFAAGFALIFGICGVLVAVFLVGAARRQAIKHGQPTTLPVYTTVLVMIMLVIDIYGFFHHASLFLTGT